MPPTTYSFLNDDLPRLYNFFKGLPTAQPLLFDRTISRWLKALDGADSFKDAAAALETL